MGNWVRQAKEQDDPEKIGATEARRLAIAIVRASQGFREGELGPGIEDVTVAWVDWLAQTIPEVE